MKPAEIKMIIFLKTFIIINLTFYRSDTIVYSLYVPMHTIYNLHTLKEIDYMTIVYH